MLDNAQGGCDAPTVSAKALMLSCMIDAKEARDITTVDILEYSCKPIWMNWSTSGWTEQWRKLDPKNVFKHIINENDKPVLYIELCMGRYELRFNFDASSVPPSFRGVSKSTRMIGASLTR